MVKNLFLFNIISIHSFDCKILLNAFFFNLTQLGLFEKCVDVFIGTYKLFKRNNPELKSPKQESLVKHFLGENYLAHNA